MNFSPIPAYWRRLFVTAVLGIAACSTPPRHRPAPVQVTAGIPPWHGRALHRRPLIAIVANNQATELSDLLVPYGILSRDDAIELNALSMTGGAVATFTDMGAPGPLLRLPATTAAFDASHPEGADFVVVPAQASSPALLTWLQQQAAKGATLVSICNGGLIVAETGLFDGRAATAHWSTEEKRKARYPAIHWTRDRRYIADGPWISTTGVSAAIPASLALIEAMHGRAQAQRIADDLGVRDWSPRHDTHAYMPHLRGSAWPLAKVSYTNRWFHHPDTFAVRAESGVDEVSLALTLDAYASTGRSRTFVATGDAEPVTTRHGLVVLPDRPPLDPALAILTPAPAQPAGALDTALRGIMKRYGRSTAKGVALVFEYPQHEDP
ncbi:MAG: DJ-1/PfpI family protein [Luteibacter sp.]|uniref:DJ-1/PfpI family protein n=1 Tax=Luteibacter sp. TaxID=1886636 RepID=UPI002807BE51|nr:DJ-1/PfpI family protein [Luteibacter sp.]MDQ7995224.1 DJ-1/PfpI family protein [Luteibacter sp.]